MRDELFRPSALARYRACPGALALESTLPKQDEDNPDAAEGRMLHDLLAHPEKSRADLNAEQLDAIVRAEKMEADFTKMICERHGL